MKFVSKNNNLCIILRPGLQAQPLTGTPAVATIYVRFNDGMAEVKDEKLQQMMLNHPGYKYDFYMIEESDLDPYKNSRQSSEPSHILTEMKYGHPVNRIESKKPSNISPEIMNAVKEMAMSLATEMTKQALPGLVEAKLKELVATHEAEKAIDSRQFTSDEEKEEVITITKSEQPGFSIVANIPVPHKGGRPKKIV